MFYSQLILAKKGPLGTIWIAAHLERKLRKNQVTETNISVSVDSILFPEAPIALRLSGHLLLGVVRIYSRKVNYLFHDCSEALTKIKQAFHAGAVDLPPEHTTAPFHAITLPENFDLDEFEPLPERESVLLASGAVDQHVTTRELITLQDPMEENIYFGSQFGLDERLPQADLPRMGLDFEEFKCLRVTNLRSEDVFLKPHMIYMREYDLMENLAEIDDGGCDDLDFSNSEEREKEAQERERSPRLTLEEEVAPSVEGYRIDFDRLDEMEAMDMEQLQAMTPAPPSMTDLDVEMEDRPEEQPEELEQLAPVVEEPEQLVPLEEEPLHPEQMELPDVPRTVEEVEEQVSIPPEVEVEVEAVAQEAGEEVVEVPDELVPALEAAAEQLPRVVSPAQLPLEMEDVPDVETLRSAVDAPTDQAPDLFAFERETARAGEDLPPRDTDQPMVEREQPLEFTETVEEPRETSVATGPGLTSPRRRPSLDLPADDDVLAALLGRSTPSLRVMPTPSEEVPTRTFRRAPKPPPRKRKPVLDVSTVLHGDVMRQQLADTTDIRRVRKKAPCTRSELWTVQRQAIGNQVFSEPSVPGLSNALRELYNRVLVPGAANLPLADLRREVTPEVAREDVPATPRAEVPVEEPGTDEQRTFEPQPEGDRPIVSEPAPEFIEEPGLELAVVEPAVETVAEMQPETGLELPAEVDTGLQPEHVPEGQDLNKVPVELGTTELQQVVVTSDVQELGDVAAQPSVEMLEGTITTEQDVEFPLLETEPEVASEPPVPSYAPVPEPILLTEPEAQEESEIKYEARVEEVAEEFVPMEEDVEVTGFVGPAIGEEQPELLQQVAAEAEAVAEAVAGGDAVVVEGVDGRTIIVLEDDGTIIDEGPSSFAVKEEVVGEEIHEEELGFLGEPRETVFLRDDDDDLHEETETYDDSVQDVTLQGFGGWSARTRAVGGYLQGVFEGLGAGIEREEGEDTPRIGLDHTLRGKTRKEAARLFFETLVLKTKDYVDVEQPQPYGEIYISARPKLMKASF